MKTYGTLLRGDSTFGISAEPHVMIKLKRWFPRAEASEQGRLVMSDTPEVASELLFMLSRWPLRMDTPVAAYLQQRGREYEETRDSLLAILTGGKPLGGDDWLVPAHPPKSYNGVDWQTIPADIVLSTGRTLCGDVLGLGKTFSALLVLRSPDARPAIVVCPPHLQLQWVRETAKFFPTLRTHIVTKTKVYDPARVRGMNGYAPDVLIISYHKLAGWCDYLTAAGDTGRVRTVIFDEIHELRNDGSQKYTAAYRLARSMRYRLGLTGTVVFNYGGDAHTIIRVLDPDALGSRSEFVREWGRMLGNGKVGVQDPRALGHHLRDQGLHIRRTRPEVGEPVLGVDKIAHEIDADQVTMDAVLDDVVGLAELIVRGGERQEVFQARGDIDWRLRRATGVAKAPYVAAFVRLLLESEERVVLWGWHRDAYAIWLDKLAMFNPVLYTGSESPRQKALSAAQFIGGDTLAQFNREDYQAGRMKAWERHERSRVLIMSLRSGAGLDGLQDVCHVGVFGELDWSPAQHTQCEGRLVDRVGQTERALMYYLHTADGSDPVVMEVLGIKREQGELIRDPTLPLFEQGNDTSDRPRLLAEQVLERAKRRKRRAS